MTKENDGMVALNGTAADLKHKTVIVLGAPRGGTSMVAGTLSKLGVFMGRSEGLAPFYENAELGECSRAKDTKAARSVIARFDSEYAQWGIKVLPKSWRFWLRRGMFREPVYVVVFRDPLAVAKRRLVSKDKDLIRSTSGSDAGTDTRNLVVDRLVLRETVRGLLFYARTLVFLWLNRRPALLVSYEKAVTRPADFVNGLVQYLGISRPEGLDAAIAFVTPSPRAYVMRSSTFSQLDDEATLYGYLDQVSGNVLSGWALSVTSSAPLTLDLYINGTSAGSTVASIPREDVQRADARFHLNSGYQFNLERPLQVGDRLEVKVAGSGIHVVNSPFVFQ